MTWFVVLVLAISSLQLLPHVAERVAGARPDWLGPITTLAGGGFAPLWAMLIVGGFTVGLQQVRTLIRQSLRVRVGFKLYLAALFLPMVTVGTAMLATGGSPADVEVEPLVLVGQIVLLAPLFALAEQLGWRAWMQRGLQQRVSGLTAGILVGLAWGAFHGPLFVPGSPTVHTELPFTSYLVATTDGVGAVGRAVQCRRPQRRSRRGGTRVLERLPAVVVAPDRDRHRPTVVSDRGIPRSCWLRSLGVVTLRNERVRVVRRL